jgi:hypothetical protein
VEVPGPEISKKPVGDEEYCHDRGPVRITAEGADRFARAGNDKSAAAAFTRLQQRHRATSYVKTAQA